MDPEAVGHCFFNQEVFREERSSQGTSVSVESLDEAEMVAEEDDADMVQTVYELYTHS